MYVPCSRLYGMFDWELSNFLHEEAGSERSLARGPYLCGPAPTQVIMLDPNIDWGGQTRSFKEMKRIIAGLVQVLPTLDTSHTPYSTPHTVHLPSSRIWTK